MGHISLGLLILLCSNSNKDFEEFIPAQASIWVLLHLLYFMIGSNKYPVNGCQVQLIIHYVDALNEASKVQPAHVGEVRLAHQSEENLFNKREIIFYDLLNVLKVFWVLHKSVYLPELEIRL